MMLVEGRFSCYLLTSSSYGNKLQDETYLLPTCLLIIVLVLSNLQRRHGQARGRFSRALYNSRIYDPVKETAR